MKTKDYLHELYEKNIHMQTITDDYDAELEDGIKKDIENEFNNNFVKTANENGVERYENIFQIKPNKEAETLQTRKNIILNRLTSHLPFTERFLEQKLNTIIGENQWVLNIDYANYEININITSPGSLWYEELVKMLEQIVPCNMEWTINVYKVSWQQVKEGFSTWNDVKQYTWNEILLGEWL